MDIQLDQLPSVKGKTLEEAQAILLPHGVTAVRPLMVDGKLMMGTMDWRPDRLNVSIQDGLITHVDKLG